MVCNSTERRPWSILFEDAEGRQVIIDSERYIEMLRTLHLGLTEDESTAVMYLVTAQTAPLMSTIERSGSGVELRTLNYENAGSNPGCGVKTLGKFFHSTLLQFTQLNKMSNWL